MLHSRKSNILPVIIVFIFVFASLHILTSDPSPDAGSPSSTSGKSAWRDWKWPVYGADDIREKDKDNNRWSDDASEGSEMLLKEETTTIPVVPATPKTLEAQEPAEATPEPKKTEPTKEGKPSKAEAPAKPTITCPSAAAWNASPLPALNTTFEVKDDIYYDPKGPRADQVIILTATDGKGHNGGIENIVEKATANRKAYCKEQGYQYHFVNISQFDLAGAHPVWKKLPAIVDAFNTYPDAQWVWMLDLDAIVMTPEADLRKIILSEAGMKKNLQLSTEFHHANRKGLGLWTPAEVDFKNIDFLVAQDHNGVNAGSFFVRRSKFTQFLIDMWADPFFMRMNWPGQEQDTVLHFVKHHHVFRQHLGLMKQRVANAFSEGSEEMRWQDGDLLVHFAGCWVQNKCQERWEAFWAKRGTADTDEYPAESSSENSFGDKYSNV